MIKTDTSPSNMFLKLSVLLFILAAEIEYTLTFKQTTKLLMAGQLEL
jgi:hypothetical protein